MPHSKPAWTSRASSLKRPQRGDWSRFQMTTLSRRNRTLEPRVMVPFWTKQPATLPPGYREHLADLGVAGDDLLELGLEEADQGGR